MADSCRGNLAGQRHGALLLLLAAGLGRSVIVALQAERLRFTEPVRAMEAWLRASNRRYGPVFRKVNRWGQLEHAALGVDAIRLILTRRTAALPPGRKA